MAQTNNNIVALIVDDSAVVRQVVTQILTEAPGIEVMGAVPDPLFAMERMAKRWPDVVILDIEMPRMDGLTFLRKIMAERPTPVLICSTLAETGAQVTVEALSAGAAGIVQKPKVGLKSFLEEGAASFVEAVRTAARANPQRLKPLSKRPVPVGKDKGPARPEGKVDGKADGKPDGKHDGKPEPGHAHNTGAMTQTTERIVAIGTSTGGTQALERVLPDLPRTCPGIVIVQHMPPKFTKAFAQRLDSISQITVREAQNNDRVLPGQALVAPGGMHMSLRRSGAQYFVEVRDGPVVNRHKPSVDVLFRSVAACAGRNALGIIMTGMGDDGAQGLLEMRERGASTLAEDERTCVVFGMPKEAQKRKAAERMVLLHNIPAAIMEYAAKGP